MTGYIAPQWCVAWAAEASNAFYRFVDGILLPFAVAASGAPPSGFCRWGGTNAAGIDDPQYQPYRCDFNRSYAPTGLTHSIISQGKYAGVVRLLAASLATPLGSPCSEILTFLPPYTYQGGTIEYGEVKPPLQVYMYRRVAQAKLDFPNLYSPFYDLDQGALSDGFILEELPII